MTLIRCSGQSAGSGWTGEGLLGSPGARGSTTTHVHVRGISSVASAAAGVTAVRRQQEAAEEQIEEIDPH